MKSGTRCDLPLGTTLRTIPQERYSSATILPPFNFDFRLELIL